LGRASAALSLAVTGSLALLPTPAAGQEGIFGGMQKGVESVFSSVETTTTLASGAVTRTTTNNVYPSLTLNLDALVYPSLRLNAGGVFEWNMLSTEIDGSSTSSTIARNRPFFLLRSTNPLLSPGIGYFRREDRARTRGFPSVKLVNEEYAAYVGWNPVGGPQSDFQFLRTNTFDGERVFQDVAKDFGSLVSNYTYKNLAAYYRGAYLKTDDAINGLVTDQISHAARTAYSGAFIAKRLLWNASYDISHQDLTTSATGAGGEVALPLVPFSGLSSLSDTPVISRLSQNPLLVDANLTAGAGINLGLPPSAVDAQARNIGLDFLTTTEVNRLLIWVDRDLPVEISNSFSWEIYSSTDNLTWRRETIVSAAPFGPFERRFEIDFTSITARYVKVVTRPLSAVVPDAPRFPDILVTEVQPFLRRLADDARDRLVQTTHLINTDVRFRILDRPSVFYEGYYLNNHHEGFGTSTDTLSNGVSVSHAFGRICSVYARGAREQGTQPQGYRVATITNATFTVDPVPTFRSSILYAGQDERIGELPNDRQGLFVQNNAQLYAGVDLLFGFGWNATTRETGERLRDRLLNVSATIVPREHLSLTFSYDDTTTKLSGTFTGSPQIHTRRAFVALAVDPIRTLHLVVGEEVIALSGQQTRTTLNLGANWLPFPEGTLQVIFAYNDSLRALEFGSDRSVLGSVRWNLSRRSFIDVTWQRTKSEFIVQTTESRVFSVSVRLFL
jgi:hypothetical protein